MIGERLSPEEPTASIKKPAAIAHTAALCSPSSIAIAISMPRIRSGTAGHIFKIGKKAHCAQPRNKVSSP